MRALLRLRTSQSKQQSKYCSLTSDSDADDSDAYDSDDDNHADDDHDFEQCVWLVCIVCILPTFIIQVAQWKPISDRGEYNCDNCENLLYLLQCIGVNI